MEQILLIIHVIITIALIAIILVQRSESDGFGSGTSGGNSLMSGRSVGNLLTRMTGILATGFMITSLLLTFLSSQSYQSSIVEEIEQQQMQIEQDTGLEEEQEAPSVPIAE